MLLADFLEQAVDRLDMQLTDSDASVTDWRVRAMMGFDDVAKQLPVQKEIIYFAMTRLGYTPSGRRHRVWINPKRIGPRRG